MRDPAGYGVYRFPRTPNKLDEYLKLQASTEAQRRKAADDEFDGLESLGGVWERDIDALTNDFMEFKKKRVSYEQEKDAAKKAQLWQESIKLGARLETNIQKSKKNKQQYVSKAEEINKDNKLFLPDNANELLEKWATTSIYDRPDNIGIERPSTLDFVGEAVKKFKTFVGDPDITSDKSRIGGGKTLEKGSKYYTEKDINDALEAAYNAMPGNFIRSEKRQLMEMYNYGAPPERARAEAALQNEQTLKDYLKGLILASAKPMLQVDILKTAPAPIGRRSGGSTKADKFQKSVDVRYFGNTPYIEVRSKKIGAKMPEQTFEIPTRLLKQANDKYKLGLDDLNDIDENSTPTVSIGGEYLFASKNVDTGEYTVTIQPREFAGKYLTVRKNISLPLGPENVAAVNSYLDGDDVYDLMEQKEADFKRQPTSPRDSPNPVGQTGKGKAKKKKPY